MTSLTTAGSALLPREASAPAAVRFGVIGAGRGAAASLIAPVGKTAHVQVDAVASRSLDKARAFAAANGLPRAYGSYDELLRDPEINAVYVVIPTGLHAEWIRRALEAGKHVFCEKPLAPTAAIASGLFALAKERGRVLMDAMAMHHLHKVQRQRELVRSGELGPLVRVESWFRVPNLKMAPGDFRLSFELGGGAGLDLGCYAVSCVRYLTGEEPQVVRSRCRLAGPRVDRWMRAELRFPSGVTGAVESGFRGWYLPRVSATATCENGWAAWTKTGLRYRRRGRTIDEALPMNWVSQCQVQDFVKLVRGQPCETALEDTIHTARVLDAMYLKAGLPLRGDARS